MLYFSPNRSQQILRWLFGSSFKSTIIRPSAFMAIIMILVLPLVLLFPADETSNGLSDVGLAGVALLSVLAIIGNAILGSWVGWGVAHWRFRERPAGVWPFWLWPSASGALLYGGMVIGLILPTDLVGNEPISATEKVFFVVFATVAGPIFGMTAAAFFRYALSFTALGSGREVSSNSEK